MVMLPSGPKAMRESTLLRTRSILRKGDPHGHLPGMIRAMSPVR